MLFLPCFVKENQLKRNKLFLRRILDHFQTKMFQSETISFSKNIGHPTLGSGGKKTFKRYLKSEQTDGQTHGQTDGQTDRRTF